MDTNKKKAIESLDRLIATAIELKGVVLNQLPDSLVEKIDEASKNANKILLDSIEP